MDLTPEEQKIKDALDRLEADAWFRYNPDAGIVERIIKGLAKRKERDGKAYCPCRLVTGNPEMDDKIVCPCEFHEQEIREQGRCHCYLFVAPEE